MTREQFIAHAESVQAALRRFLTALCCGDTQLADDIAQESLLKAYMSCDSFRDPSKFNAWIYKIAYNTFITHRRTSRPAVDYTEANAAEADSSSDSGFEYQDLYHALDKLQPKERSAILLYYMEGYSIKEIAAMVDASVDAIKQHLSRGRNHLRGLLSR